MDDVENTGWIARELRSSDEAKFGARVERTKRTKVHTIIPHQFFSAASTECRELYIDGHFYGCISLAQAVAEGLSRFLCRFHCKRSDSPKERERRLRTANVISQRACEAFATIRGGDRNTFHHMNEDVPANYALLEERAQECIGALYDIESEVFAFDISDGHLVPRNPEYWPRSDSEHVNVQLRCGL